MNYLINIKKMYQQQRMKEGENKKMKLYYEKNKEKLVNLPILFQTCPKSVS